MATGFSSASVYKSQTPTGFRHQVFIMYHGTRAQNIESILDNGFRPSGGGTLGPGIYVSFDIKKAQAYGPVVFKLLVYVGKVCKIDRRGHPLQTSWQSNYGCAWITTNSGFALQENCIKDNKQVHVLGVCKGFDLLPASAKAKTKDLSTRGMTRLQWDEKKELDGFVKKLRI